MAYVTYKNRTSQDYRFTVTSLDDPEIANLKAMLVEANRYIKTARARGYSWGNQNTKGIRIRPRGPRGSSWAYDTPASMATHFDVYIREYR